MKFDRREHRCPADRWVPTEIEVLMFALMIALRIAEC
jgi:hypothetical protein